MNHDELLSHIIEIKEMQASMSTEMGNIKESLQEHRAEHSVTKKQVESLKRDVHLAKGVIGLVGAVAGYLGLDRLLK